MSEQGCPNTGVRTRVSEQGVRPRVSENVVDTHGRHTLLANVEAKPHIVNKVFGVTISLRLRPNHILSTRSFFGGSKIVKAKAKPHVVNKVLEGQIQRV